MQLVLQVRLTEKEAGAIEREPGSVTLEQLAITTVVAAETLQQATGKTVTGEIVDHTGKVLKTVP